MTAPTEFTPLVLPALVEAAPPTLVYLGSGAGHVSYPNNAAYVASKHALAALAHATYADVAAAVRFIVEFGDHGCPTEIRLEPHLG